MYCVLFIYTPTPSHVYMYMCVGSYVQAEWFLFLILKKNSTPLPPLTPLIPHAGLLTGPNLSRKSSCGRRRRRLAHV